MLHVWNDIHLLFNHILYPDPCDFWVDIEQMNWMAERNLTINLIVAWHCAVWNQVSCFDYII